MVTDEEIRNRPLKKGLKITIIISILWIGFWTFVAGGFSEITSNLSLKLIFLLGLPVWIYMWYFWHRYNWRPPVD
jgi:hypothetical protein